jgi:hypothetical protein
MAEKVKNFNDMRLFKISHLNLKGKAKEWYTWKGEVKFIHSLNFMSMLCLL